MLGFESEIGHVVVIKQESGWKASGRDEVVVVVVVVWQIASDVAVAVWIAFWGADGAAVIVVV